MKVINQHERTLPGSHDQTGKLIDQLSSDKDLLWPFEKWMPMKFDKELSVGAKGGHGPIRYTVTQFEPSKKIVFRFDPYQGQDFLKGRHYFELVAQNNETTLIRHVIDGEGNLGAYLKWKLLVEPLHDAIIEDAFDKAEEKLGTPPKKPAKWCFRVRGIRFLMKKRK